MASRKRMAERSVAERTSSSDTTAPETVGREPVSDEPETSKGAGIRRVSKGRPFPKGRSGNPGGQSKAATEVRAAARSHTPWAIKRLRELAESKDGRVALMACKELLDRGIGRAAETVDEEERALNLRVLEAKAKVLEAEIAPRKDGPLVIVVEHLPEPPRLRGDTDDSTH